MHFVLLFVLFWLHLVANEKADLTVMVPMRDGVALPTDLYLPEPDAKNHPCILIRGPLGRHARSALMFTPLAKEGYVVAIQDTRSAIDPEGKTLPYLADGWGSQQDGYDTVEWLAKNPVTNGKIGTLGYSNMGITQLLLAPTDPDALVCQYIGVAAPSLYHHALFPGGRLLKNQVEGWLGLVAKHPSVLEYVKGQNEYNDLWASLNALPHSHRVTVPALHMGGWYDIFIQGTLDSFVSRQKEGGIGAEGTQKLVVGPWMHHLLSEKRLGDFDLPPLSHQPPYDISPKSWFDFHLKGLPNLVEKFPPVLYYVMGPFDGSPSSGNRWRTAEQWPVPHVKMHFYLSGDRQLVEAPKKVKAGEISFPFDPKNLVPTIGGRNLFLEAGPKDQRPIEDRPDVAVFTTDPLEEDLEVTGRIAVNLQFSSDREQSDVAVRLTDVYPDGRSILIAEGLTHAGKSNKNELSIDLWSTSLVFAKGHRIRLIVSGSNYPRYEEPSSMIAGTDTLHLEPLSFLTLPAVRKGERWLLP